MTINDIFAEFYKDKITCVCGCKVMASRMFNHLCSRRHQQEMTKPMGTIKKKNDNSFHCKICNKSFLNRNFYRHMNKEDHKCYNKKIYDKMMTEFEDKHKK
jgi:hypothetical protein